MACVDIRHQVRQEFPHVDFTGCEVYDPLDPLETIEETTHRVAELVKWVQVWVQEQQFRHGAEVVMDVVVVTHFVFLHRMFERLGYGPVAPDGEWAPSFKNCEMRVIPLETLLVLLE